MGNQSKQAITCNNLTSFLNCTKNMLTKLQTYVFLQSVARLTLQNRCFISLIIEEHFLFSKTMGNQSKQAITCNNLKSFSNDRPGMIVVKIICLHFRIDGHHLFRSIPLASRKLHRSQSVDEPVSQISHGNFTNFLAIKVKFCLKIISSNLFNCNI